MSCDVGEMTERLENEQSSRYRDIQKSPFSNLSVTSPTSQLILQSYRVHRCGASGRMRACHAAGPGSIPGRDKFPE